MTTPNDGPDAPTGAAAGAMKEGSPHVPTDLLRRLDDAAKLMRQGHAVFVPNIIERASARIRELEAQQQWRPIETAPKDGSRFLVWDDHYGTRIGRAHIRPDHDDWLSYMDAFGNSSKGGLRATHWQPLSPTPPKEWPNGQPATPLDPV